MHAHVRFNIYDLQTPEVIIVQFGIKVDYAVKWDIILLTVLWRDEAAEQHCVIIL